MRLPNTLKKIGQGSFQQTGIPSIVIPPSVNLIDSYAFAGCAHLYEVKLSEGLYMINDNAFGGCCWLKSVSIPKSVMLIGSSAFKGCYNMETIDILSSDCVINYFAFENCDRLYHVQMPEPVEKQVKDMTFYKCNIKKITLVLPNGKTKTQSVKSKWIK